MWQRLTRLWYPRYEPQPQETRERWVIALATCDSGTPYKYFRYCPYEVWKWTPTKARAEIFPSRKTAEHSAMWCSVYYKSSYRIMRIG